MMIYYPKYIHAYMHTITKHILDCHINILRLFHIKNEMDASVAETDE